MVHLQSILIPPVTSQITFTIYSIILSACLVHAIIKKLIRRNVMHAEMEKFNPRNNELLFSYKRNGKRYCGAVDDTQDNVDYTTAFYFDAVLYIAATTHKYLQRHKNNSIFDLYKDGAFFEVATDGTLSTFPSGATGEIKFDIRGDRDITRLSLNIWNSKIQNSEGMDELFRAGIFDLESKSFKCSYHEVFSSEENLHPINPIHFSDQICTPSLIFNSPDNKVPKRLAGNTLTCNLAFATSIFVPDASGTISWDNSGATRTLAMLLAVAHVNNKTDGIHDSLLSNTRINYIWKNTGRDDRTSNRSCNALYSKIII